MEQTSNLSRIISQATGLDETDSSRLADYAMEIFSRNRLFNLTGHKSIEEITSNLIINSITPALKLNVPRGTCFADLGTGAGIPGVPLAVLIKDSTGVLFDSNSKKISFIEEASAKCGITGLIPKCARIEEWGKKPDAREHFDWVFSRAMSEPYMACELAAPILKKGGFLFLYSGEKEALESDGFNRHIETLGLELQRERTLQNQMQAEGILYIKKDVTPEIYPRRIAAIKRGREKI